MTKLGTFENVRFKNCKDYKTFYEICSSKVESAKNQNQIEKDTYNLENCCDEFYITCVPWIDFTQITHPIPDDKYSQCIPRICWGKYVKRNNKYELTLNITVSHIFVDGYLPAKAFNKIQELLDNVEDIKKIIFFFYI